MSELFAWKFIIPPITDVEKAPAHPDNPALHIDDCYAVALAPTKEAALKLLHDFAAKELLDIWWLQFARVEQVPISQPGVLTWIA